MSTTEPQFNDPPRPFHQYPLQYCTVRLKLGLFGAELLKCCAQQIRTKSAKVSDGRPPRARRFLHGLR